MNLRNLAWPTVALLAVLAWPLPDGQIRAEMATAGSREARLAPISAVFTTSRSFEIGEVTGLTPADAVAYLTGGLPGFESASADALSGFSSADILETMDTSVLDAVRRTSGEVALADLHAAVARATLDTLLDQYGSRLVVVPLDAGHGGAAGYYWDPGSEGTEAWHTRAVIEQMDRLSGLLGYSSIVLRRVFNDEIADDFRLPPDATVPVYNQLTMRLARSSVLAATVRRWNAEHADQPDNQVAVHALSIHFNAGANGLLVLHQSPRSVAPALADDSLAFARRYAVRGLEAVNATGRLQPPLKLWAGTGLHDDAMLYRPAYISPTAAAQSTPRYGLLQGSVHLRQYVDRILANWR